MPLHEYAGRLIASNTRLGIIVSRFNESITNNLLQGALETAKRYGISEENIHVVWVPGAFEIPLVAKKLAVSGEVDAVICLGCLIKGATDHYQLICQQVASGIAQVAREYELPVVFEVLTVNTVEDAMARSGGKAGNKGAEAIQCAIEMVDLLKQLPSKTESHLTSNARAVPIQV
ncbi:MAG: 6,7-dimethyl-8-ribityllumazine synthase [Waddliaceae bacterium]|nr:6,7-dimethyl-8-ribityllumazine synthase [Waddliaceae bacterium]